MFQLIRIVEFSYLTTVSYSMYFDYPFGLYSEYPSLLIQDVVLMILIVLYDRKPKKQLILFVPLAIICHSLIGLKFVPRWLPVLALVSLVLGQLSEFLLHDLSLELFGADWNLKQSSPTL